MYAYLNSQPRKEKKHKNNLDNKNKQVSQNKNVVFKVFGCLCIEVTAKKPNFPERFWKNRNMSKRLANQI